MHLGKEVIDGMTLKQKIKMIKLGVSSSLMKKKMKRFDGLQKIFIIIISKGSVLIGDGDGQMSLQFIKLMRP